jgi:D-glycero-D-manno-heptose 1,7-bisphosphate phosphatase
MMNDERIHVLRPAIFLDRDGTVNEERHYLSDPALVALTENVAHGIAAANQAGFLVVVVTNQAGVGRGYFKLEAVEAVNRRIEELLALGSARIDRFYACPHHPREGIGEYLIDCDCRKPKPGMLQRAAEELGIDLSASLLIGDTRTDLEAGAAAGCRTMLVRTCHGVAVEISPEDIAALNLVGIMPNAFEAIMRALQLAQTP